MRTDAARNRTAMLDAAELVFAEQGLDASLNDIARRAGVGNATLYRHFATRGVLLDELFERQMEHYVAMSEAAAASPDPDAAFRDCITATGELQASNRALADLLVSTQPVSPRVDELRRRQYAAIVTVVERAVAADAVRADLRPADVAVLLIANAGLIRRTADDAPGATARLVALWLEGAGAQGSVPPPPSENAISRVLRR